MVTHDILPRDANGIVQGAYRILHESPTFHGTIGVYEMREGQSVSPAFGRALLCAIGEYGARLYLEPWGDKIPSDVVLGELISAHVPAETVALLERCPWRPAPAEGEGEKKHEPEKPASDGLDDLEVEALRAMAADLNLGLAKNIGKPKALIALRAHAAKVAAEAKSAESPAPAEGEGEKSEPEEGGAGDDDAEKGEEPTE